MRAPRESVAVVFSFGIREEGFEIATGFHGEGVFLTYLDSKRRRVWTRGLGHAGAEKLGRLLLAAAAASRANGTMLDAETADNLASSVGVKE